MAKRKRSPRPMPGKLKVPREDLDQALDQRFVTNVEVSLLFDSEDVRAAVVWALERQYNYNDLGSLLAQWALDGSPGSGGPDIDETQFRLYITRGTGWGGF